MERNREREREREKRNERRVRESRPGSTPRLLNGLVVGGRGSFRGR